MNVLSGVTPGVCAANKAMVLDANKSITGIESITLAAGSATLGSYGLGSQLAPFSDGWGSGEYGTILSGQWAQNLVLQIRGNSNQDSFAVATSVNGGNLAASVTNGIPFRIQNDGNIFMNPALSVAYVNIGASGGDKKLKLNGTLVTATATELNLLAGLTELPGGGGGGSVQANLTGGGTTYQITPNITHVLYNATQRRTIKLPDTTLISVGHTIRFHMNIEVVEYADKPILGLFHSAVERLHIGNHLPATSYDFAVNKSVAFFDAVYLGLQSLETGQGASPAFNSWVVRGDFPNSKYSVITPGANVLISEILPSVIIMDPDNSTVYCNLGNGIAAMEGMRWTIKKNGLGTLTVRRDPGAANTWIDGEEPWSMNLSTHATFIYTRNPANGYANWYLIN